MLRKAVSSFDHNSKVAGHVHNSNHNMDFENTKVVGLEANYHERLFLEAWHSTLDLNAGNDHIKIPEAYGHAHKPRATFFLSFSNSVKQRRAFITDEGLSISQNV